MGMTKAIQERVFVSANILTPETRFVCVRYGNVLASRGSVIPLFHEQIRRGGPVTVTRPEMTRFLLSLDQAVDTVLEAMSTARPGETFLPKAPAAKVIDVARALVGDRKVEIKVTGIRPGEKMHEVLVSEEECHHTRRHGGYYAIASMLPELAVKDEGEPLSGELSSADALVGFEEVRGLLEKLRLLVEQVSGPPNEELLR